MSDTTPIMGEYGDVRQVVHGDGRDVSRRKGVVVGLPRTPQDYYRLVDEDDPARTFDGHVDDARLVPDGELTRSQREFRDNVKKQLSSDPART